jgi:hypothetical protein
MFKYNDGKALLTASSFTFSANRKEVSNHFNLSDTIFLMPGHIISSNESFKVGCRFTPGLRETAGLLLQVCRYSTFALEKPI